MMIIKQMNAKSDQIITAPTRILSLDYLRGLMALSVMAYHYTVWGGAVLEADSILRKLGIYAVSVFYILSGLSLAIVYKGRLTSWRDAAGFWIRRLYRIAPLYWLTVTAALLLAYVKSILIGAVFDFDVKKVLLNYTLSFGFIAPDAYLTTGAWSIGNELVFYSIFPLVFLLVGTRLWLVGVVFLLSLFLGAYFAFDKFIPDATLTQQWITYINPANQFFLFWAGVLCGTFCTLKPAHHAATGYMHSIVLIALILIFWWYPIQGGDLGLVVGGNRVILSMLCIAFVWVVYGHPSTTLLPKVPFLAFLGEACYSIYLLHPLIGGVTEYAVSKYLGWSEWLAYCLAAMLTLVISYGTLRILERPMIERGSLLARKVVQWKSFT